MIPKGCTWQVLILLHFAGNVSLEVELLPTGGKTQLVLLKELSGEVKKKRVSSYFYQKYTYGLFGNHSFHQEKVRMCCDSLFKENIHVTTRQRVIYHLKLQQVGPQTGGPAGCCAL